MRKCSPPRVTTSTLWVLCIPSLQAPVTPLKAQAWAYLCDVPCSPVLPAVEYPAADPGHGEAQGGEGGQEQLGVLGGGGEEEEEEEGCWVEVGKPVRRRSAGWRWVGL